MDVGGQEVSRFKSNDIGDDSVEDWVWPNKIPGDMRGVHGKAWRRALLGMNKMGRKCNA